MGHHSELRCKGDGCFAQAGLLACRVKDERGCSSHCEENSRPATKPFDCKGSSSAAVADVNKTDDIADPLKRNRQITADYVNLYKKTPDLQWAGLASVVSRNAGCGMVKAGSIDSYWNPRHYIPTADAKAQVANKGLADTNQTIYRTVGPTMTFVSRHGANQLKSCTSSGAILVSDHSDDKTPNAKLDNSSVPPALQVPVDTLAKAENLPAGSKDRQDLSRSAADDIAEYEQQEVVRRRIYDANPELKGVMESNQYWSDTKIGRAAGATSPTVALSADCDAEQHVQPKDPKTFSINNPKDRVDYYKTLMGAFTSMPGTDKLTLINALSAKPGF